MTSAHHIGSYVARHHQDDEEHSVTSDQPHQGDTYEIRLAGHLDERWEAWLDGMELTRPGDGTTVLRGRVADQAALHGLLLRLRDIGLPLVSLAQVDPG